MSGLVPEVSADTHEERMKAIQEYPHLVKYALEGNPYYAARVWQTHVAFTFWAATPWRWNT